MKKGKFITFEGPDGSGKTTVSTAVTEKLQEEGYTVRYTREPGGSEIAEEIRGIILDPKSTAMDARTEALLYAAARRQHLVDKVIPCLEEGISVISDRFVDSSLAYQGYARHIGVEDVMSINQFAIEAYMPDKTIYLDVTPEEGLKRISDRAYLDRLDQESLEFHQAVYQGYRKITGSYRNRIIVVNANRPLEEVIHDAYLLVKGIIDG